jgi:hypothetical protein
MFENVSFCQPLVAAFHSPGEHDLGALSRLPRNRPNCLTIREASHASAGLGVAPTNDIVPKDLEGLSGDHVARLLRRSRPDPHLREGIPKSILLQTTVL